MNFPTLPASLSEIDNRNFTSVYDVIEFAENTFQVEFPARLTKPLLTSNPTSEDAMEFAKKLAEWEVALPVFHADVNQRMDHNQKVDLLIEEYIKRESGFYDIPKRSQSKVWNKAWEDGHSSGYGEVYSHLRELVDLFD